MECITISWYQIIIIIVVVVVVIIIIITVIIIFSCCRYNRMMISKVKPLHVKVEETTQAIDGAEHKMAVLDKKQQVGDRWGPSVCHHRALDPQVNTDLGCQASTEWQKSAFFL